MSPALSPAITQGVAPALHHPVRRGAAARGVVVVLAGALGLLGVGAGGLATVVANQRVAAAQESRQDESKRADEAQAEVKALQVQLKQAADDRVAAEEKLAKQGEIIKHLQQAADIAASRQDQFDASFQKMRTDLEQAATQGAKDKADLAEAQAKITTLEAGLAAAQGQVAALGKAKAEGQAAAQGDLAKSQQDLAKTRAEAEAAKAAEKTAADRTAQMQAKLDADQKTIKDLEAQIAKLREARQNQPAGPTPRPVKPEAPAKKY